MSKILINQYYQNLDRTLQFGKSSNEQSIRNHFWSLLNEYARKLNYEVVPEVAILGTKGKKVHPDGTVKNLWGLDIGLWESKDEKDDIESEIDAKIKKGYPLTNILFEDSNIAVLFQRGVEVNRVKVRDAGSLHKLLTDFISFKSETVYKFEDAIGKFKADIPIIVRTLRNKILESRETNKAFLIAQAAFFELCKVEINPDITIEDIREMLIQHILTSDIFNKIFDDHEFHHHNTIAAELENLIGILFTYAERKNLLYSIEQYYEAINVTAGSIIDHHEKQKFLKVLYENFYKVYNPKAADRLGVVYTPNEIVTFMVDSTDFLLNKHFEKTLDDKNVEILDPATGTGTFITMIIDHIPKQYLAYKYKNEIHANEVGILPYYVANLNIEYTFKQKMNYYEEFQNLCFVDTLDNTDALAYTGKQHSLFGLSSENTVRIRRQNTKKISVIIGNPPYNANQLNENENNKNRVYSQIDKRIKNTYIKYSKAQKTKVYDMYARFYRWASDRVANDGIVCFITNNSFINSKTFDGFRKCIQDEFQFAYIIDLGGNIRDLSGKDGIFLNEKHTIFGKSAAVGIAIALLIKDGKTKDRKCLINYIHPCDIRATRDEKLDYLKAHPISQIPFKCITPDKNNNWINLSEKNDWDELIPISEIFELNANGISTNRDEWVYDLSENNLASKISFFISKYNELLNTDNKTFPNLIKWSSTLKSIFLSGKKIEFNKKRIKQLSYRPFILHYYYLDVNLSDRLTENHFIEFGKDFDKKNTLISFNRNERGLFALATEHCSDLHFTGDSKCLPLYRYDKKGNRIDNITDLGLKQFHNHYCDTTITKEEIFHYIYAVLHNSVFRKKYEQNLRREFPRLPLYNNFQKWVDWGKKLIKLHVHYEAVSPFPLILNSHKVETDEKRQKEMFPKVPESESLYTRQPKVKVRLKADKEKGQIEIDELTFLSGVPREAWEYKLGNRSALEWILDQYKEKTYSKKEIEKSEEKMALAEKFNNYKFADHKDKVIDLLKRVCTLSVETVKIIKEMEQYPISD